MIKYILNRKWITIPLIGTKRKYILYAGKCCYMIKIKEQIVYIGNCSNLNSRILSHNLVRYLLKDSKVNKNLFLSYCAYGYDYEYDLITHFKPLFNIMGLKKHNLSREQIIDKIIKAL